MTEKNVRVETHNGYKSPGTPRAVYLQGKKYEVGKELDARRAASASDGEIEERFRVNLKGFGEVEIAYNYAYDEWTAK